MELVINRENEIKKVYSGKVGCMCGCLGKYWTDQKSIKRIVTAMKKAVACGAATEVDACDKYVYVEMGTRCFTGYYEA